MRPRAFTSRAPGVPRQAVRSLGGAVEPDEHGLGVPPSWGLAHDIHLFTLMLRMRLVCTKKTSREARHSPSSIFRMTPIDPPGRTRRHPVRDVQVEAWAWV